MYPINQSTKASQNMGAKGGVKKEKYMDVWMNPSVEHYYFQVRALNAAVRAIFWMKFFDLDEIVMISTSIAAMWTKNANGLV